MLLSSKDFIMEKIVNLKSTYHYLPLYIQTFLPENPKIIMQIVPGMSDYIDRYWELAEYLNQHDIAVVGHDHLGQGKTANEKLPLGDFGKNGEKNLVNDTLSVSTMIKSEFPDTPLFLLGHSLGSMVATQALRQNHELYDGTILLGMPQAPKISDFLARMLNPLVKFQDRHLTKKINKFAYKFYNREYDLDSRLAWTTNDPEKLAELKNDPLVGYDYELESLLAVLKLSISSNERSWQNYLPKDFPILALSGSLDPAGDYGFRLMQLAEDFEKEHFTNAQTHLCYGMQHELQNDVNRKKIYRMIDEFILMNTKVPKWIT